MVSPFITWLSSPLSRVLIALLVLCGAVAAGYIRGQSDAGARCEAAALRDQVAGLKRDIEAARRAAEDAQTRSAAIAAREAELQERVTDYEQALALRPDSGCRLDADDVRRLRELAPTRGTR